MKSLREAAQSARGPRRKILVDLDMPEASDTALEELRAAGMVVRRVVGNKVFGEIDAAALPNLRRCRVIRAVEESAPLSPAKR